MKTRSNAAMAAVVLAMLAVNSAAWSQCPGPDGFGFTAGCCTPAMPNLPLFPTMTLNGLGACIRDCGVESQFDTVATIVPTPLVCDYWIMGLTIVSTSGPPFTASTALLAAKYARTWFEFPIAGAAPLQVWRFLVNGDLTYAGATATGAGCPIPLSALAPYNLPVHYIGHIDYAMDCATGAWQIAYSLSHFCPTESHAPFSARPIAAAAGWPKRTYHFVGPANFVFGLCAVPDGPIIAESTRTSVGLTVPVPYTCLRETQVVNGQLNTVAFNCVCNDPLPMLPPSRYAHQTLFATEVCAGAAAAILSFGGLGVPFLPTGLRAEIIGSWVPAAGAPAFPGAECVSVYLGILDSPGLCGPVPPPFGTIHAVTGVGTTGGFGVMLPETPTPAFAPLDFLDLENMLLVTPFGFTPGFGALFGSERVWSFNML
jgi:hypothetical protein